MRQILVDYGRRHVAAKRGSGHAPVAVDPDAVAAPGRAAELVALDEALAEERLDERLARVMELRFFGGLSVEETGDVLGVSPRTIKRDWRKARAFLYRSIQETDGE